MTETDEKKETCYRLILLPTEENPEYNQHNGDKKTEIINTTLLLSHLLNTRMYRSEVETGLEC
jgi:hypothetical protein